MYSNCSLPLPLWLRQVDAYTVIVHQFASQARSEEKNRQQNNTDQQVRIRWQKPNALAPRIPAICSCEQGDIVERRVRQCRLKLRPHRLSVSFKSLIVVLHLDELLGSRDDGRNCGDEANGLQVVGATADVGQGGAHALDERSQLELCCGCIEDVETPG